MSTYLADGPLSGYVERPLDLAEGSDERRVAEKLVEQETVRFVWVNEDIEAVIDLPQELRANWKQALEATRGVDRDAWREEMEEWEWRRSPSWRPGRPRPRKLTRSTARPPERPVPFFARRSGAIPRNGSPTVAGFALPPGSRLPQGEPAYWATDDELVDAAELSSRLAAVFADSGLWPLLWAWPDEGPDGYFGGHGDLDAIDEVDVHEVMRAAWERSPPNPAATAPFGRAFPGLGEASPWPHDFNDPFGAVGEHPVPEWGHPGRRLLLVPCNRPADALTALGYAEPGIDAPEIGAVLRSWEERFSAVPVELQPSIVTLAVGAPPTGMEQALRLAAEQNAVAPLDDGGRPGTIRDMASLLLGRRPHTDGWMPSLTLSPTLCQLAFREE